MTAGIPDMIIHSMNSIIYGRQGVILDIVILVQFSIH